MSLPVSINPCEDLNSEINDLISSFESEATGVRSTVDDLRQSMNNFSDTPSTSEIIDSAVDAAGVSDVDAGSAEMLQIRNFTGSCLDSVLNSVKKYSATIDEAITEKIDQITSFASLPEVDMLEYLRSLRSALGASALSALLTKIDEKLGCLSDQGSEIAECLSLVSSFNSRVNTVLSYLGLGSEASQLTKEFDIDEFVSSSNIIIDTSALTNLKSLDTEMTNITKEAIANATSVLKQQTAPLEWF